MKKTLLVLSLIIATNSHAQKRDTTLYKAGIELIKYERQYTTGIMMQLAGSAIVAAGAASLENSTRRKPMIIGGAGLTFIGFVMQLLSSSHIKKAGILLRNNKSLHTQF